MPVLSSVHASPQTQKSIQSPCCGWLGSGVLPHPRQPAAETHSPSSLAASLCEGPGLSASRLRAPRPRDQASCSRCTHAPMSSPQLWETTPLLSQSGTSLVLKGPCWMESQAPTVTSSSTRALLAFLPSPASVSLPLNVAS